VGREPSRPECGCIQRHQCAGGLAPFNIANINAKLYVTYAKQDADKEDDIQGLGNGIVDTFDMTGALLGRLVTQGTLNSPWGMAMAPTGFGDFGGMLLVGNFGDGLIHAFDPNSDALAGTLMGVATPGNTTGSPLVIQGLWTLVFGNGGRGGDRGTLYFTAGIPGTSGEPLESHGLFGSIQAAPLQACDLERSQLRFDARSQRLGEYFWQWTLCRYPKLADQ
jgi:uncharacterized protein (TIGR03118 family)